MMKRAFVVAVAMLCIAATFSYARGKDPDVISYCCGVATVTPGTPITLDFQTNLGDDRPIGLRVYRIGVQDAIAIERNDRFRQAAGVSGTLVWSGQAAGRSFGWLREVSVGPFPIGLYVVQGSIGTASVGAFANVTTLGVAAITGEGESAFWPVDLRTFRTHAGPIVVRLAGEHSSKILRRDTSGLALLSGSMPSDAVFVARAADGSVDVEQFWRDDDAGTTKSIVQTDRPVYRPGQTVYYRAILRDGYEGSYRIPDGSHTVEIIDPDGTSVYKHAYSLSRFGTLNGSFQLPSSELGYYRLNVDGKAGQSFYVEAYKKPEYVLRAAPAALQVVGGDDAQVAVHAAYFFGRPAAGMRVHYRVSPNFYGLAEYTPYVGYAPRLTRSGLQVREGETLTDAKGGAIVRVGTPRTQAPYFLTFSLDARDDSGRTVATGTSVMVYPAAIRLSLTPSDWYAKAGTAMSFDLASSSLDGKMLPNVPVHLTFVRSTWDSAHRRSVESAAGSQNAVTGTNGHVDVRWRPAQAGSYRIEATAVDVRGNVEREEQYLWVMGDDDRFLPPLEQPVLIPQKNTIAPGERPRVLVRMPAPGRDVVLAVTTDHLVWARVVHVTGYSASIGFDAPKDATVFTVHALLPSETGITSVQTLIHQQPAKELIIHLGSDRAQYEPGQRASIAALVTDAHGKPVQTELSLDVVDEAVYAVQTDNAIDPVDRFFGLNSYLDAQAEWYRPNYVPPPEASAQGAPVAHAPYTIARVASHAASGPLIKPGITSDVYDAGTAQVRKNFADTAYWTPAVVTGKNGRATIDFTWPDNLTTWRTTAVGVTADTSVGSAQRDTLVTKDFLVRLETPRFLREGDRSTIVGIAQGQSGQPQVQLTFQPDALDPLSARLHLDDNQSATASWPLDAGSALGIRTLSLSGTDGARTDAMQLQLPIESAGAAEHVRDAGELPRQSSTTVALGAGYDAGTMRITLTPSIAAQLLENVRLLDVYPYYCTEQTMSSALPAIFVDRLLHRSGLQMPGDLAPAQVVQHAIGRLSQLQHDDGSWGWWEHDAAHPYMTAYAVYGLAEFKKAGYSGLDEMLARGVASLREQLLAANTDTLRFWGGAQRGSEWNTRAFMLFALADAAPAQVDRDLLAQTLKRARSLNSYALSVLGLTYHEFGDDARARGVLELLNERAITRDSFTYWTGDTWHYAWEDDPIETTAYALRLNAALAPGSPIVDRTVAFLRFEQRGSWWYTTKDTAAAVYAIAQAEHPSPGEFHPDETVTVFVADRPVKTVHITSAVLNASDAEIDVPAAQMLDGTTVRIERSGTGSLYWASDFTRYAPWSVHDVRDSSRSLFARLFPPQPPLGIERRYVLEHRGAWRIGDVVHVELTVSARDDVQYVAIEDPFPAGVEYAPPQGEAGSSSWSGMQFFDDRAVFFADRIYRGEPLHLSYDLRVTTPGSYAAPPPTAYAMYGPPVSAAGRGEDVIVQQ